MLAICFLGGLGNLIEEPSMMDTGIHFFYKDDINIVLGLSKGQEMNLLSRSKFTRELEVMKTGFALMIFEENEVCSDFPQEVQPLLKEFADVIPEEIPPGLPPLTGIQHCIDFFPAVHPNKA